jgi:hypothetical protein
VPFAYYKRLTATQKATYRKSDSLDAVIIPDVAELLPLVAELQAKLASGKRAATAKATSVLVLTLCRQLGAPPVRITVRSVRPEIRGGELHGLYTFAERGTSPTIDVWMKTAAHQRVVAFRTFLRTVLHEVMHHLDVSVLELKDSFHTEGFYRRESSVMRQLVGRSVDKTSKNPRVARKRPVQLDLF